VGFVEVVRDYTRILRFCIAFANFCMESRVCSRYPLNCFVGIKE
jgi:hypothetical protein